MLTAVSLKTKPIEFFDRNDWDRFSALDDVEKSVELLSYRNPFEDLPFAAVWGFDERKKSLIFADSPRGFFRGKTQGNLQSDEFLYYLAWVPHLRDFSAKAVPFGLLLKLLENDKSQPAEIQAAILPSLKRKQSKIKIESARAKDYSFYCLYNEEDIPRNENEKKHYVLNSLSRLIDYYHMNAVLWSKVPREYLVRCFASEYDAHKAMFDEVRRFDPFQPFSTSFTWPWQKCLSSKSFGDQLCSMSFQQIPTISMVMDIRSSTVAMQLTRSPEDYASFIDEVVKEARRVLLEFGGYFDKETGDGIVGHFCALDATDKMKKSVPSAVRRCFDASKKILETVRDICADYQNKLELGVDSLGAGIGIHSGTAVWVTSTDQIRAIGQSVVMASRISDVAATNQIVMSYSSYYDLLRNSELSQHEIQHFDEIILQTQEFGPKRDFRAQKYQLGG